MASHLPPAAARRGFTLVELLIVIAIIIGLSALTFTATAYLSTKAQTNRAEVQLQALANGLQEYKLDVGSYPENSAANAEDGAEILYQALSGNGNDKLGSGSEASTENPSSSDLWRDPILPELLPGNNKQQNWVGDTTATRYTVIDPWGEPWHYVAGDPANQHNVEFDLWSVGPDGVDDRDSDHGGDDLNNW